MTARTDSLRKAQPDGTVTIPVAEYKYLRDLYSIAGDLWNELERCRSHWQEWDDSNMVEEHIRRYEKASDGLYEVVGADPRDDGAA